MSLDVYLTMPELISGETREVIFVRKDGQTRSVSRKEWDDLYPGREPIAVQTVDTVYEANITHNLNTMAAAAGIYKHLWRPDELGITKARELIEPLRVGLALLQSDRERFEKFNASNGWGLYEHFVPWVRKYLAACEEYPDANVSVSR